MYTKNETALLNLISSINKQFYYIGEENDKVAPIDVKKFCLLYTSPSPRDATLSRMPSSA